MKYLLIVIAAVRRMPKTNKSYQNFNCNTTGLLNKTLYTYFF